MVAKNYRVALYLRLSRDDGNEESQSIQSQREILTNYVDKHGWYIVDEYIDDGYSGTNFERPDFKRLIGDIELGKIDMVITKDLSRLGRNYIQVGYYTEEFFPQRNIRYIAVVDDYDSDKEDGNDFMPFRNIINEWYARDTSKKIRSILNNKAASGEPRNTVFPIFGYTYNERFERVPDSETAPIVQLIFRKFIELGSTKKVTEYLIENKIKTPRYYNAVKFKYNREKVLSQGEESYYKWAHGAVRDILVKEEYLGVYKTAQSKSISYKNKKRHQNVDCYVFENRYTPLIDKETWELARKMLRSTNGTSIPLSENIFRGLMFCADCGKPMRLERRTRLKFQDFNYRYFCEHTDCEHTNSISKKMLEGVFVREFFSMRNFILSKEEEFLKFAANYDSKGRHVITDIDKDLERAIARNDELDGFIANLFENSTKGLVPSSTYTVMMGKYQKEKVIVENQIRDLTRRRNAEITNPTNALRANDLLEVLKGLTEENVLEHYIIHKLIKKISVRTRSINNSNQNREIEITITYYNCDEIINGFLTYEG